MNYLYGPFSSYAPTYDSSFANISKEDSDLIYSFYGEDSTQPESERCVCVLEISHIKKYTHEFLWLRSTLKLFLTYMHLCYVKLLFCRTKGPIHTLPPLPCYSTIIIWMCVCVCVCVALQISLLNLRSTWAG